MIHPFRHIIASFGVVNMGACVKPVWEEALRCAHAGSSPKPTSVPSHPSPTARRCLPPSGRCIPLRSGGAVRSAHLAGSRRHPSALRRGTKIAFKPLLVDGFGDEGHSPGYRRVSAALPAPPPAQPSPARLGGGGGMKPRPSIKRPRGGWDGTTVPPGGRGIGQTATPWHSLCGVTTATTVRGGAGSPSGWNARGEPRGQPRGWGSSLRWEPGSGWEVLVTCPCVSTQDPSAGMKTTRWPKETSSRPSKSTVKMCGTTLRSLLGMPVTTLEQPKPSWTTGGPAELSLMTVLIDQVSFCFGFWGLSGVKAYIVLEIKTHPTVASPHGRSYLGGWDVVQSLFLRTLPFLGWAQVGQGGCSCMDTPVTQIQWRRETE